MAGPQQFVGHQNIVKALDLLAPYLGTQGKALLTGASAGGFGTLLNFPTFDDHFSSAQTYLLDDSGPIFFADNVLSPPLQAGLVVLFRFDLTFPEGASVYGPDGLQGIYSLLSSRYPDSKFALASHFEDLTIRTFFGPGQAPGDTVTPDEYAAGLRDIRSRLPANWGTYFATTNDHTFIGVGSRYNATSGGVALNDYVRALVNGSVSNVEPTPARPAAFSGVLAAR